MATESVGIGSFVESRVTPNFDTRTVQRNSIAGEPSQDEAAIMLNVGRHSFHRAREVLDEGAPEPVEAGTCQLFRSMSGIEGSKAVVRVKKAMPPCGTARPARKFV